MKTQADFQNAAAIVLADLPEPSDTPAPPVAEETDPVETEQDQNQEATETAPDHGDEPDDKPEDKPEVKPEEKRDLVAEAKKKAELRAKKQKEEATETELAEARKLVAAAKKGDAVALLSAAGISWNKAAKQVIAGDDVTDEKPEEKPDDKLTELQKEVQELKAERNAAKNAEKRQEVVGIAKTISKADEVRFAFVEEFEAHDEAVRFVEKYFSETGELPGEDLEDSLEIGLEHVERQYSDRAEKQAEKLQKALTKKKGAGNKSTKQEVLSAASKSATKTLTNSSGGPQLRSEKTKAKSTEDYQRAAVLALPDAED